MICYKYFDSVAFILGLSNFGSKNTIKNEVKTPTRVTQIFEYKLDVNHVSGESSKINEEGKHKSKPIM